MSDILIRASLHGDANWGYDDPSGVTDVPLAVQVPEGLRADIERAAAREGMSPATWLLALVSRSLLPTGARGI